MFKQIALWIAGLLLAEGVAAQLAGIEVTRLDRPDIPASNYSDFAAVALEGGRALLCPDVRLTGAGSCLVFQRPAHSSGGWSFVREIANPQPNVFDKFGSAAALQGDVAVVGVPGADAMGLNSGAVSVHHRQMGGTDNWGMAERLVASDPAPEHVFSRSVALAGDTLVVGAPTIALAGSGIGAAYVFQRDPGEAGHWSFVRKLTASDASNFSNFGFAVAIHGDRIAVGAPGAGSNKGAAYVFERNLGGAGNWGELARVAASDGLSGDYFGSSVALDSATLAVGAPRRADVGGNSGAVYLYATASWSEQQKLTGATQEGFGTSLAFGDNLLAVGAPSYFGPAQLSGSVGLFQRPPETPTWSLLVRLHAPGASSVDAFGSAVDMDGAELIVGAPFQGAAYVFSLARSPVQVPALDPLGLSALGGLLLALGVRFIRRGPHPTTGP